MRTHMFSSRFLLPLTAVTVMMLATQVRANEAIHAVEIVPPSMEDAAIPALTQHLFMQLPAGLNARQQADAMAILTDAGPRIAAAQGRVATILEKLRELSFSAHSQADALTDLGQELVVARDALRAELRQVSAKLEKGIGINPRWDVPRSCAMPQAVHRDDLPKN